VPNWTPEQRARYYANAKRKRDAAAIAAGREPGKQGQPSKNRTPEQLRELRNIKSKKYWAENREKMREYKREYERKRAADKARAEGRLPGKSGPKRKYATNEEYLAAQAAIRRRYYQENREKLAEAARIREQKKRDAIKAGTYVKIRIRPQTLEEKRAIRSVDAHRRRARILGAGGAFTAEHVRLARRRQNGLCLVCHRLLGEHDLHTDHWVPLTKGGSNDDNNIAILHGVCNLKKGTKHPAELGLPDQPLAA
jgi:5-methylcytosine-specific restriction endonuclease McrA